MIISAIINIVYTAFYMEQFWANLWYLNEINYKIDDSESLRNCVRIKMLNGMTLEVGLWKGCPANNGLFFPAKMWRIHIGSQDFGDRKVRCNVGSLMQITNSSRPGKIGLIYVICYYSYHRLYAVCNPRLISNRINNLSLGLIVFLKPCSFIRNRWSINQCDKKMNSYWAPGCLGG